MHRIAFLAAVAVAGLAGTGQAEMKFVHHYIATDLPGTDTWGWGPSALADFDNDGDLDFAVSVPRDGIYWFENLGKGKNWQRHVLGKFQPGVKFPTLGCTILDVDQDGWIDVVIGGFWFRNSQDPRNKEFVRHNFDPKLTTEMHDVVAADIDGDGKKDIVLMTETFGMHWYKIPADPTQPWERTEIGEGLHGGFAPEGIGDLDGDGDLDIARVNAWFENQDRGKTWVMHPLPFGKAGPWGISGRSVIVDLDGDGDNDIVCSDCDQAESTAAWLENDGTGKKWIRHDLPLTAPGKRSSFHSLRVADFEGDGDLDILTIDQEDLMPEGHRPRWYIWENDGKCNFTERVILDAMLGGHDAWIGDIDGDGDLDIASKIWSLWNHWKSKSVTNANGGRVHVDWLENQSIRGN